MAAVGKSRSVSGNNQLPEKKKDKDLGLVRKNKK